MALTDVHHLIQAHRVDAERLLQMARSLAPRWEERLAGQTADQFVRKVETFLQQLRQGSR